ncbi:MAG: transcriptional regulator, partial [Deltaproteobacteria bacterium]|nr:transcriptional regulator [Deltaproteobacteria bacterium]
MKEHQNMEWKESWRDEYLKWICAFANAEGGLLVIGKNDAGKTVGVPNARKLLKDLPNKIRDVLGLIVPVNLRRKDDREFIEIVVQASPYPVSYKGEYHIRSGSTRQELKGASLDQFLLGKQGRHWDAVPVPNVSVAELNTASLNRFRSLALRSGRLDEALLDEPDAALVEKLKLTEGTYLKRAAVLLFHADPTVFVSGAFVKIGFFRSQSDLLYHDEVAGDLFGQVHQTLDLLYTKYLKAVIHYERIQRVERFPVPRPALREAVLNALVHRVYAVPAPVQIRIYEDRLSIWNPALLPQGWTVEKLRGEHASIPFNPDIANAFFRAGEIESWGRGIHQIFQSCLDAGSPEPRLHYEPN